VQPIETQVTSHVSPPVTLAVTEHGLRDASTHLVLMHGFPDDHRMWDALVAQLPEDWHVVTYDSRGTGRSSRPTERSAYVATQLVEDLVAVLDATVPPGAKAHLVGHDWGSVIGWEAVAAATWDPRLEDRLATYTSISGPPLDHVGTLASTWRGRRRLLPQLAKSWYTVLFRAPLLPRLTARSGQVLTRRLFERLDPTARQLPWGSELASNTWPAVGIYGANLGRVRHPQPWRTSTPVLLVVATRDAFISPRALEHLDARCRDLTRVEVDCGHWVPRAEPEWLAGRVVEHVERQA
jgi:pimeloyl-ACP methyl ester carboxylesterase